MYVCASHACLAPSETRSNYQWPWNWAYRQLRAPTRVLGTEPGSSLRAADALTATLTLQPPPTSPFFEKETHYSLADLELVATLLPHTPNRWDYRR